VSFLHNSKRCLNACTIFTAGFKQWNKNIWNEQNLINCNNRRQTAIISSWKQRLLLGLKTINHFSAALFDSFAVVSVMCRNTVIPYLFKPPPDQGKTCGLENGISSSTSQIYSGEINTWWGRETQFWSEFRVAAVGVLLQNKASSQSDFRERK